MSHEAAAGADRKANFALIGAAGFIAPRHLKAIREVGGNLLAAVDPHDSVGMLDSHFPHAKFFTEIERFDRFLESQRRNTARDSVDYITVCSPNYLHDAHVRLAMRVKADAICEKPLVISPWNLDQLADLEQEHGCRVFNVLQLRLHPAVQALKASLEAQPDRRRQEIHLTYVTRRGPWYHASWKGSEEKSGGLSMNIGIHFFDMLLWLFGAPQRTLVHVSDGRKMAGTLELKWATVRWFLSVDAEDLPAEVQARGGHAYRSLTIGGEEFDFSDGFNDLHTAVYRDILAGRGFGIEDARPSIELVYGIRNSRTVSSGSTGHPLLRRVA